MTYGLVYAARLKKDGRLYIGKTTQALVKRKSVHKCNALRGHGHYFHAAIRKYGFDAFEWCVLRECNNAVELSDAERVLIEENQSNVKGKGFNLTNGGEGWQHSEETKQKIGEANRGEKNGMYGRIPWNKGKRLSKQHRENLSKAHLGQKAWNKGLSREDNPLTGRPRTEEVKRKISEANRGEKNGMFGKTPWNKGKKFT